MRIRRCETPVVMCTVLCSRNVVVNGSDRSDEGQRSVHRQRRAAGDGYRHRFDPDAVS